MLSDINAFFKAIALRSEHYQLILYFCYESCWWNLRKNSFLLWRK